MAKRPLAETPDGWIESEASFTELAQVAGAPVARVLGIERVDGRSVSIYERIEGPSMWDQMTSAPDLAVSLACLLADLQAHLFTLAAPAGLPAQRDRVTSKIRNAADRYDRSLLGALDCVPPAGGERALCHGDLHPGNVIIGRAGPVLIDWFDASGGARAGDVARSTLLQSSAAHGPDGPRHLPHSPPELLELAGRAYRASILDLAGVDEATLERWTVVMAVARMSEGVEPTGLRAIWARRQCPPAGVTSARGHAAP